MGELQGQIQSLSFSNILVLSRLVLSRKKKMYFLDFSYAPDMPLDVLSTDNVS